MWPDLIIAAGLFAAAGTCVAPPIRMALRLRRHVQAGNRPGGDLRNPPGALVILPCKGIASELPHLEENLRPVLEQDYPNYRVVFAIESEDDLAADCLRKLAAESDRAMVVVADHRGACSQKVANQLRALDEADDEQVYVFLDSDARPDPGLLGRLTAPLADPQLGATTGFRWYLPERGGFGSWVRAAWNTGGLPFLVDHRLNYAWGGAMAIRRDVFERCGIGDYWGEALSDDLGLSAVVKQAGLRIEFVPQCLVLSPEDLALGETIEWTSRQTVICRVYNPPMWRLIFFGEAATMATATAAIAAAIWAASTHQTLLAQLAAAALVLLAAGRMLYQAMILAVARRLSPELAPARAAIRLIAAAPLISPLMLYNSLRSWVSRRIRWRGIGYVLHGPRQIEVIRDS